MRILVFGATGQTGLLFTELALNNGHHVTAFVRNPVKLTLSHPRLGMVKGDVYKESSVIASIEDGYDAVVNMLGVRYGQKEQVCTESTRHILKGMQEHGIKRYVVLGGAGSGSSKEKLSGFMKWFAGIYTRYIDPYAAMDKENQYQLLLQSDADYTLVAAPWLTNGKFTGQYRHGENSGMRLFSRISRADAAHFLLSVIEQGSYKRKEPFIFY